jgi:hypothetical protein
VRRVSSPTWWMAALFAGGSACFVVASLPGFVQLVGSAAVGVVYFVGSLQFTSAAAIQWWGTIRRLGLDWWSGAIQFAGTLLFNVNTYHALEEGLDANSSGPPTRSARSASSVRATSRTRRLRAASCVVRVAAGSR